MLEQPQSAKHLEAPKHIMKKLEPVDVRCGFGIARLLLHTYASVLQRFSLVDIEKLLQRAAIKSYNHRQ